MGFVNQLNIKEISQFTGITLIPVSELFSKILGIVWLLTSIIFIITAYGFTFDKSWWIIAGVISVIISQLMIILYWRDAKAGTAANALICAGLIILF
jgi:hypothetical protein